MNTGLNMTVHHLLAVYSGGKVDLSGSGHRPNTGFEGQGAGIGMLKRSTYSLSYQLTSHLQAETVQYFLHLMSLSTQPGCIRPVELYIFSYS